VVSSTIIAGQPVPLLLAAFANDAYDVSKRRIAVVLHQEEEMPILDRLCLDGRIALVTGASHGIGEGMALGFAEAGADVALAARSTDDLERVAASVRALGRRALVVPTDVADLTALQPMVDRTLEEFGSIDILGNVAGVGHRKNIFDCTPADWDYVINIQLRAVYFTSQIVARVM
jgi:NAD(P)-dependent dehydrogenase (short-subunit alcohol dehydrogenase family)